MFNKDSIVANTWAKAVRNGVKTVQDIPNIQNLREVVLSLLKGGE